MTKTQIMNAALQTAYDAGYLSMCSVDEQANYFDCPTTEVSDHFENLCQNILAQCAAAGVSAELANERYSYGQTMAISLKRSRL